MADVTDLVRERRAELARLLTLDTFVTSDSHWCHRNIQAYEDRPEGHEAIMRQRWFETVKPDDVILHLGDLVVFGRKSEHDKWIEGLPGKKFLLLGNHDDRSAEFYARHGFEVIGRQRFLHGFLPTDEEFNETTVVSFSHEPDEDDGAWDINVHGHLHSNEHHETPSPADRVNVCVELTDYRPVRLRDVLVAYL